MYRVFTIAMITLMLGSIAGATTSLRTDGEWWVAMSESQRIIAVQAIADSYPTAYGDGYVDAALKSLGAVMPAMRAAHLTDEQQLRLSTHLAKVDWA